MISSRIKNLQPSPTMALDAKAKALKKQGAPVINLGPGEPDFETPQHIKEAAVQAITEGFTRYTHVNAVEELRQAIADKFLKENNIAYDASQVIVSNGAKQVIYSAFQTLCEKDDEVILSTPTWTTFIEQVKLAEGKPVLIPLQAPFILTAKDIEAKLTPKTKALLINSPSNPTGAIIPKEELQKIADLAVKHNFYVIADEIYERLTYGTEAVSIASLGDDIKNRTITVNGVSKSYAMTGWRIGYAAGPKEIISAMSALQGQMTSNASSISQKASLAALRGDQKPVEDMRRAFAERREYLLKALSEIPGFSFAAPEGAFYFFISVEKLLGKAYPTSAAWCEGLLEKEKVAVVPGEAFLAPGYFRLSFAASMEDLQESVMRIKKFIG